MNNPKERQPAPRLNLRGVQKYLNAVEAPRMENRRLIGLCLTLGVAVVAQGIGFMLTLPLKERVPYAIEVETTTGNVVASDRIARKFEPGENNIRYFLGRWVENLLAVDELTRSAKLPASYSLLKGQALADWQRYVTTQGRPLDLLAENPNYRLRAELISITFLTDEKALIRVKLTNDRGEERRVVVDANFAIVPPQSDEDVQRNPIGLWITSFGVQNELA